MTKRKYKEMYLDMVEKVIRVNSENTKLRKENQELKQQIQELQTYKNPLLPKYLDSQEKYVKAIEKQCYLASLLQKQKVENIIEEGENDD